jgi:hypothetical protein
MAARESETLGDSNSPSDENSGTEKHASDSGNAVRSDCNTESIPTQESKVDDEESKLVDKELQVAQEGDSEDDLHDPPDDTANQEDASSETPKLSKNAQKRLIKKALLDERRKAKKLAKKEQKAARRSTPAEGEDAPSAAKRQKIDCSDGQDTTETRSNTKKKGKEDFDALRLAGQVRLECLDSRQRKIKYNLINTRIEIVVVV